MNSHHKLKKDRYVKTGGGNSYFLELYCSKCNAYVALYQKDGIGSLLRLYLDRIFEPKELASLQNSVFSKNDIPALKCLQCNNLLAVPMIYEEENRLAFRLVPGSVVKKKRI